MDQAVLVMTGRDLKLTTPNDVLTARDSLEYWSQKHMAVARGNAVVVTNDGRRLAADTLVAYTTEARRRHRRERQPRGEGRQQAAEDPLARIGQAAEGGGVRQCLGPHRRPTRRPAIARVYVPDTGHRAAGGQCADHTRAEPAQGSEAEVNMKTGIARLLAGSGERVQGLVVPNDDQQADPAIRRTRPVAGPSARRNERYPCRDHGRG